MWQPWRVYWCDPDGDPCIDGDRRDFVSVEDALEFLRRMEAKGYETHLAKKPESTRDPDPVP